MNKNNVVSKTLFSLNIDGTHIEIACRYNIKTNYISIYAGKKYYYVHKKKNIKHAIQGISVCKTFQRDAIDLKNDPYRLSTMFKQRMIMGVNIND